MVTFILLEKTMYRVLAAALILIPAVAYSQNATTTQGSDQRLQARASAPLAITANRTTTSKPVTRRISTGVVAPRLLQTADIDFDQNSPMLQNPNDIDVMVRLTVNADGTPRDVQMVKPVNAIFDGEVVAAVEKYRFSPGTLNSQPIEAPVTLQILFKR